MANVTIFQECISFKKGINRGVLMKTPLFDGTQGKSTLTLVIVADWADLSRVAMATQKQTAISADWPFMTCVC